jgi:hypothetical protein
MDILACKCAYTVHLELKAVMSGEQHIAVDRRYNNDADPRIDRLHFAATQEQGSKNH